MTLKNTHTHMMNTNDGNMIIRVCIVYIRVIRLLDFITITWTLYQCDKGLYSFIDLGWLFWSKGTGSLPFIGHPHPRLEIQHGIQNI